MKNNRLEDELFYKCIGLMFIWFSVNLMARTISLNVFAVKPIALSLTVGALGLFLLYLSTKSVESWSFPTGVLDENIE